MRDPTREETVEDDDLLETVRKLDKQLSELRAFKDAHTAQCIECGHTFTKVRHDQVYCTDGGRNCRQRRHSRRVLGGLKLYDAVIRWRLDRPKGALAELTAIADVLAEEERMMRRRRAAVQGTGK